MDDAVDAVNGMDEAPRVEQSTTMPEPESLTNAETWYHEKLDGISDEIDRSLPLEGQARQAMDLRNQYKLEARKLMQDRLLLGVTPSENP